MLLLRGHSSRVNYTIVKFLVGKTLTIHGDADMSEGPDSNIPILQIEHGKKDMMISGFNYE